MSRLARTIVLSLVVGAAPAFAHDPDEGWTPVGRCRASGTVLECKAGHANGSPDAGLPVALYTADGRLIQQARANADGIVRFRKPAGDYYVLLGDKRGDTVEVDWRDVDASPFKRR